MSPRRILVVDDSAVARRAITQVIRDHPDLELAGLAENGEVGLRRILAQRPDAVVLDLHMPVLDGRGLLKELQRRGEQIPVVVLSSHVGEGPRETVAALAEGAVGFVPKPSSLTSNEDWVGQLVQLLLKVSRPPAPKSAAPPRPKPIPDSHGSRISAVVVGVSTGGPETLEAFLSSVPGPLSTPMLIVQHMPEPFPAALAERLASRCRLPVQVAAEDTRILRGHVYLAPGGRHLGVVTGPEHSVLARLSDGPREAHARPAADHLFRTAAEVYGRGLLAIVMTGLGHDGLIGSAAVVERGGTVLAQDAASCVVDSMPAAVRSAGLEYASLSPQGLAAEVAARGQGRTTV